MAYEKARDMDAVVRLNLNELKNPQAAFSIVRDNRSTEGAALIATHCKQSGNVHAAVRQRFPCIQDPSMRAVYPLITVATQG